ncbi:MAG: putative sulfate exporter family transporter [Bacteroidota bacterium]|nr:putative sulfate exporter family transporter [Bacteroidota bacterium]
MQLIKNERASKIIFIAGILFCLLPFVDPPIALLLGILLSQVNGLPFASYHAKLVKILLQISVVGLGFGMNLFEAAKAGKEGFLFTIATIALTFLVGIFLGRLFKIDKKIAYLISTGTAICGGSAIAAVSPVIGAKPEQISVSLGTVFILNSVALLIFPFIGHLFDLSQPQFGLWAAIAIHDTSSVVGAAAKYGTEALQIATTVKLERALWIIPLSLITAWAFRNKKSKINIPYFIFFFVGAMALNTFLPQFHTGQIILLIARKGLTVTLFLIGSGLTAATLKAVGIKPLLLGIILWVLISVCSLLVILASA